MSGFRCTPEPAPAAPFLGTQGRSPGLRADVDPGRSAFPRTHFLPVRSGSDSIAPNQGLRVNSITVAGAAPDWV